MGTPKQAMSTVADEIVAISTGSARRALSWSMRNPHVRYEAKVGSGVLLVFDEDLSSIYIQDGDVFHVDKRGRVMGLGNQQVEKNGRPAFPATTHQVIPRTAAQEALERAWGPLVRLAAVRLVQVDRPYQRDRWGNPPVSAKELQRLGVRFQFHGRQGPRIEATKPVGSARKAESDAEALLKKFKAEYWPGGMGAVVAVVEFSDGQFVGIANLYVSGA